jgi:CRP/FNR family transcriptional regulator, cyclic AMP receptor protein
MAELGPLSRIGFLGRLPPEVAGAVAEGGHLTEHPARAVTFIGDETVSAGVAVSGLQRVYLVGPDGREVTIRYVFRGELLGAIRLPSVHVSIATQALETAAVFHFQSGRLEALAQRYPQLAIALLDEYAERLGRGYRALFMRAFGEVKQRLAQDLYWRAEALGAISGGNVVIKVTQQDLADSIGSVREMVARVLDELDRDGLIKRTRSTIVVPDPERLIAEAGC